MRSQRERDQVRLNNIFLEMGMDKDVASIISGVNKKRQEEILKLLDKNPCLLNIFYK